MIKSIETNYNGYRFRSRLEARCVVFLEAAKIPYCYEPEGFVFENETRYLPDFYLEDSKTFLECKGVMSEKDERKIKMLAEATGTDVVIVNPNMEFEITQYTGNLNKVFPLEKEEAGIYITPAMLLECLVCHKKYFVNANGDWDCKCCGYKHCNFDTVDTIFWFDDVKDYEPTKKAKRARFEYGEDGT